MSRDPIISIVTSRSADDPLTSRAIVSVRRQGYAPFEHIVVDEAATERGRAQAINQAFRTASGEIFGWLNEDDALEPGALRAVADAFRAGGTSVVIGRCRLVDSQHRYFGVEQPSAFDSHQRLLEIWKGECVAQPSTFWTRTEWDACGPLREDTPASMLFYDFCCRLLRRHHIGRVDQVLASSRLAESSAVTRNSRLEDAIAVSRHYWGSPLGPRYWQLLASYAAFRLNRRARAARLMRRGRQLGREHRYGGGFGQIVFGSVLAPDVALDVAVPVLKPVLARLKRKRLRRHARRPDTEVWLSHTALHTDGWAGPTLVQTLTIEPQHTTVALSGTLSLGHLRRPLELEAFLDNRPLGRSSVGQTGPFAVTWRLTGVPPGAHELRINASAFAVPHEYSGNLDFRPLSYRVVQLKLAHQASQPS
jgi:hypothetical protein